MLLLYLEIKFYKVIYIFMNATPWTPSDLWEIPKTLSWRSFDKWDLRWSVKKSIDLILGDPDDFWIVDVKNRDGEIIWYWIIWAETIIWNESTKFYDENWIKAYNDKWIIYLFSDDREILEKYSRRRIATELDDYLNNWATWLFNLDYWIYWWLLWSFSWMSESEIATKLSIDHLYIFEGDKWTDFIVFDLWENPGDNLLSTIDSILWWDSLF